MKFEIPVLTSPILVVGSPNVRNLFLMFYSVYCKSFYCEF